MNSGENNKKKFKRPRQNTLATTNPESSRTAITSNANEVEQPESLCPLLAKDSEWVDILHAQTNSNSDQETILQLVDCEEGPETKPLVLMFPELLNEDPEMIEGMLNKVMSTSEVTKHLVGHKANFAFMKKVKRLIPNDKKWLETLTENSVSLCSILSELQADSMLSDYEADTEDTDSEEDKQNKNDKTT